MNEKQKEILKFLGKLWDKFPEQRLGQLLENYIFFCSDRGDRTSIKLFYQKDEDTLRFLKANLTPSEAQLKRMKEIYEETGFTVSQQMELLLKGYELKNWKYNGIETPKECEWP